MPFEKLEQTFPELANEGYRITSEASVEYNCIAWAIEKDDLVWWPDAWNLYAWPEGMAREEHLETFVTFFQRLGYETCAHDRFEPGFGKVALYVDEHKRGSHVAKQLKNGKWTSKLGPDEDIEHNTLVALTGIKYGKVGLILKRPLKS